MKTPCVHVSSNFSPFVLGLANKDYVSVISTISSSLFDTDTHCLMDHFTVVCLVAWPCKLPPIGMRTASLTKEK